MRAVAVLCGLVVFGCSTTPEGERKVDRSQCLETVRQATVAKAGCGLLDAPDDRERCELAADVAIASARLGCSFADDIDAAD